LADDRLDAEELPHRPGGAHLAARDSHREAQLAGRELLQVNARHR
jgi:hypothetical protein